MIPIPTSFVPVEQPPEWQVSVDGVFIKQMVLAKVGHIVPQHVLAYDHHSMLAHGAVRLWADGQYAGDFVAPSPILIRAGVQHTFMALEDETIVYCIHRLHGTDAVELLAEARPLEN